MIMIHHIEQSYLMSSQEAMQFWVLDSEATEERKEDWISRLFKMSDEDGSPRSKGKKSPTKSRKGSAKAKAKAKATKKAWEAYVLQQCSLS